MEQLSTFTSTIGIPQGESLSPVLSLIYVIYLEVALHDLKDNLPQRPRENTEIPYYKVHADFISNASQILDEVQRIAPGCLSKRYLNIDETKTERTDIHRRNNRAREDWRMTRKLRSLLGMEKATCGCGFQEAVVYLGQTPLCIPRPLIATVQRVYNSCDHIQHWHVGTNANGFGQV